MQGELLQCKAGSFPSLAFMLQDPAPFPRAPGRVGVRAESPGKDQSGPLVPTGQRQAGPQWARRCPRGLSAEASTSDRRKVSLSPESLHS